MKTAASSAREAPINAIKVTKNLFRLTLFSFGVARKRIRKTTDGTIRIIDATSS